mgnify:FL=1
MSHRLPAALLLAATLSVAAAIRAQEAQDPAPAALPDLSALLECRLGYTDFMAYMPVLQDPLKAVALGAVSERLGRQPIGSAWCFTGFLASPRNAKSVVLHIQDFQQD